MRFRCELAHTFNRTLLRRVSTDITFVPMKLDELQREAERLNAEERRKLIGFLVSIDIRKDRAELTRRLSDQRPEGWIALKEAERRLKNDGL